MSASPKLVRYERKNSTAMRTGCAAVRRSDGLTMSYQRKTLAVLSIHQRKSKGLVARIDRSLLLSHPLRCRQALYLATIQQDAEERFLGCAADQLRWDFLGSF